MAGQRERKREKNYWGIMAIKRGVNVGVFMAIDGNHEGVYMDK